MKGHVWVTTQTYDSPDVRKVCTMWYRCLFNKGKSIDQEVCLIKDEFDIGLRASTKDKSDVELRASMVESSYDVASLSV